MQLEWSRWVEGITAFKGSQGLFLWFPIVLLVLLRRERKISHGRLMLQLYLLGGMVLFPVTAVVLMKLFTPFYDWLDLQQLLQLPLLLALSSVALTDVIKNTKFFNNEEKTGKPALRLPVSVICVMMLLMIASNFHAFDKQPDADVHGVPTESAAAFEALQALVGETPVVIAAPSELLQYVRLYETDWIPLYGRDLWNGKAAGYVNSGYDIEYAYYTFLERTELDEKERPEFAALISLEQADCIMVPYYWREDYCPTDKYTLLALTSKYNVIIKKELVTQ